MTLENVTVSIATGSIACETLVNDARRGSALLLAGHEKN